MLVACIGATLLSGCSASYFRRAADRDVYKLLKTRKVETIGYDPESVAGPEEGAANLDVPDRAYATLPVTQVAKTQITPLEPIESALPFAPFGPDMPEMALPGEAFLQELQAAPRRRAHSLRLGPPMPGGSGVIQFGLYDSIRYAVQNNRDYRNRMEDLYLAALTVTFERHLLTPRPFGGVRADFNRSGRSAEFDSAVNATANLGLRQQIPYGGEVVAEGLVRFVEALDGNAQDGESADLVLRGSLPLLRGFGMINLEPLISSERGLVYNIRGFERFRRGFAVQVSQRYFRLLTSQSRISNRYLRYISALRLVERTLSLFEAGSVSYTEVQRAQSQALRAEDSLNESEEAYAAALDDFKIFLGMDVETPFDIIPTRLAVPEPDLYADDLLDTALTLRLDLQTTRDRIDDAKRAVANSRNGLLPDLDLSATGRVGSDVDKRFTDFSGDDANFAAGVDLNLPLDQTGARNALRRSLISFDRAMRSLEESEDRTSAMMR
ncbi:MAG: TolC family protein, partial [Planctomycetota bacterium]